MVTNAANGFFPQRFQNAFIFQFLFISVNVFAPETNPNSTNKRNIFKTNIKINSLELIIFDNNHIFHSVYKYMHITKINVFTGVFHRAAMTVVFWS